MKWLDNHWWIGMEHLIGIHCPATPEEPYSMLILQKDQHRIRVKFQAEGIDIAAVQTHLRRHPKWPIVIVLDSDFVMEAILDADQMADPISSVLGVKIDDHQDFEYIAFPHHDDQFLVAVIRSETIQAAITPLADEQSRIINVYFAHPVEGSHPSRSESQETEVDTFQHRAAARKVPTLALDASPSNIPHSSAIDGIHQALQQLWSHATSSGHLPWREKLQTYIATSRLRQIAVVSATALAIGFLLLFFLRTRLESEKKLLEEAYAQNLPVFNAIHKLDEKIEARAALNAELGGQTLRSSKVSFFLDRLAAITPAEIRLTELIIGPEEEDFKRQGIRDATPHDIILCGESDRSAPVTSFSQAIEQIPWVQAIAIPKSELNLQEERYQFVFLLRTTDTASPQ